MSFVRLDDEVRRIMEGLEVEDSCRSLPAVTPTAAFGEGISALSDEAVCYPGSLWSAFTAACPRLWRSRQDTRPSVATGLPDHSNGALREAALNGEATTDPRAGRTGLEPMIAIAAAGEEHGRAHSNAPASAAVLKFVPRKGPGTEAPGQVCKGGMQTVTGGRITTRSTKYRVLLFPVTRRSASLASARGANR